MRTKIILGITGSIAAYKAIEIAKTISRQDFEIEIVLTKSAVNFVPELTLRSMFPGKVHQYDASIGAKGEMLHVTLAQSASFVIIAPASANIIAKIAGGFSDCLLSTICLTTKAQILIAPAMNKMMWSNPLLQSNIKRLQKNGAHLLGPARGQQACGDFGLGRMLEPEEIVRHLHYCNTQKILHNKKVVITSGPTREKIDPVRFLSNYSSGKMGHAIAETAYNMGATVTVITGHTDLQFSEPITVIRVESAADMLKAVKDCIIDTNVLIGAAAVSDYQPVNNIDQKIQSKQNDLEIKLVPNVDILSYIANKFPDVFCVGFSADTRHSELYGTKKLYNKNLDMIAINDVSNGKVFNSDFNAVKVLMKDGRSFNLAKATKREIAAQLLEIIAASTKKRTIKSA